MPVYAQASELGLSDAVLIYLTTDPADNAQWPDDFVIEDVGTDVDALIDAHLRKRYTLPLAHVDPVLRNIALALWRLHLYQLKPGGPAIPDDLKDASAEAMRQLRSIGDGKLDLGAADATPVEEGTRKIKVNAPDPRLPRSLIDKY